MEYKGIIFPLYTKMTKRAIRNGKDVFVKFSPRKIKPGMILYIYGTGENGAKKIIAKSIISRVDRKQPHEVWEKYRSRLFQNEDEYKEYTKNRGNKELLILELENPHLLEEPIDPPGNMTVSGLYVDEKI
jgi:hypothetical protein